MLAAHPPRSTPVVTAPLVALLVGVPTATMLAASIAHDGAAATFATVIGGVTLLAIGWLVKSVKTSNNADNERITRRVVREEMGAMRSEMNGVRTEMNRQSGELARLSKRVDHLVDKPKKDKELP